MRMYLSKSLSVFLGLLLYVNQFAEGAILPGATAKMGQTLTYSFPPTGTDLSPTNYYAVCVKGASWADVTTGNADYTYDISSTKFGSGDKMSRGAIALEVPDVYESCKGGTLFQMDLVLGRPSLDLTLKATIADDAAVLTVCAFYNAKYPGTWAGVLPPLGFTQTEGVFYKDRRLTFVQPSYVPPSDGRINTLCRDFAPNDTDDQDFFAAAVALPPTISYTFPATGLTIYPPKNSLIDHPSANLFYGICIQGAQFASTTNSYSGYPDYKMVTRQMKSTTDLWSNPFWWEKPRKLPKNMRSLPMCNAAHCRFWSSSHVQHYPRENASCEGGVFLQPQERERAFHWVEDSRGVAQWVYRNATEFNELAENKVTVNIIPKNGIPEDVKVCALVTANYQKTPDFWDRLDALGFTETHASSVAWYRTKWYCKDMSSDHAIHTASSSRSHPKSTPILFPTMSPTTISPTAAPTAIAEVTSIICPEDIRLLKKTGVTDLPLALGDDGTSVVNIVSQDKSTVTVELNQAWNGSIDKFFYYYKPDVFTTQCAEEDEAKPGVTIDTITLQCDILSPYARLYICLQDMSGNLLDEGDKASVPKCCYSDAPVDTPTVCYSLQIACETECGTGKEFG